MNGIESATINQATAENFNTATAFNENLEDFSDELVPDNTAADTNAPRFTHSSRDTRPRKPAPPTKTFTFFVSKVEFYLPDFNRTYRI